MKRTEILKHVMKKLTKSYVSHMPVPPMKNGKHTYKIYRDNTLIGFAVRVASTGEKTFIIDKKVNNKLYRIVLGKFGVLTVEEARNFAQKQLGQLAMGIDPRDAKKREKVLGITLRDAFNDYLDARKDLKKRTRFDYEKIIAREFTDWSIKPLLAIKADDVARRHKKIGSRTPVGADNAFKLIKAVFNFAKSKYKDNKENPIIKQNPVDILSDTRAWYGKRRRKTIVKIQQLPAWYKGLMSLKNIRRGSIAATIRDYLIAMLFTGARKSELQFSRWSKNFDFEAKVIQFFDTKNRLDFVLPFSDFVYDHFKSLKARSQCDFVFPNAENTAPFVNPYKTMKRVSEETKKYTKDGKPVIFTLHDLRRTFITTAESLDISMYAIKRLINHKMSGDVTAGYIISEAERLRKPMQRVTDCLLGIIHGKFESYADF